MEVLSACLVQLVIHVNGDLLNNDQFPERIYQNISNWMT